MQFHVRQLSFVVGLALLGHLLLLADLPLLLQAVAVLLLTGWLPGYLLVAWLVGQSDDPPTPAEAILYAIGAGYGVMVMVMLLLSYLPGGVTRWQTLLGFDLCTLGLLVLTWLRARVASASLARSVPLSEPSGVTGTPPATRSLLILGFCLLLLIAGFFRFAQLGYSEFQGDEARAALRAAAVIQGVEDVLLLHKKGPTEILLPTVVYALTDHLNEATARLPFTVANFVAFFAVFVLGWRLLGPLAGWAAAFLLAFDGYLIGFSQIVQYQSVIVLTSALVVLVAQRVARPDDATRHPPPATLAGYLTLAAILLATGLLSHYEAAQAGVPLFVLLLGALIQRRIGWLALLRAAIPAVLVGGAMLASFYVPFIRHPHFSATYTYLVERRISGGSTFPFNNLEDFFLRSTVYNSTYFALLLIGLVTLALWLAYRTGLPRTVANGLGGGLALLWLLTFWNSTWLQIGAQDWIVIPFAVALLIVWLLPRLRLEERALWFWFGAPMLLAFFFTSKPRSHVYIFFAPWALLAGKAVEQGWYWLRTWLEQRAALAIGGVTVALCTLVFGNYAYWYFVHSQVEVLRTWPAHQPAGYWIPYTEPDNKAIFGFPLANGWKVIGTLYQQGILQGDFETNEKEAWVPAWYTRGERRCGRSAQWFFEIDNLEPWTDGDQKNMEHRLRGGFTKWGKVVINGADRMIIYQRTGQEIFYPNREPNTDLPTFHLDDYAQTFDLLARPAMTLTYPTVEKPISHPLQVNLGNELWLEGYDISYPQPLRPKDMIKLTLFWRAQKPLAANYKVFNQSFYGNGTMIAQRDGYPVCDTRETWRWDPGELIEDEYDIPVQADAPDGLYPLYTGMYVEETGVRLPIIDAAGNPTPETQIHLTDIRVGVE